MARDAKILIRVTEEVKDDFDRIAAEHGMTASALGSYVIGAFIRQQKQIVEPMNQSMKAIMEQALQRSMNASIEVAAGAGRQPVSEASIDAEKSIG